MKEDFNNYFRAQLLSLKPYQSAREEFKGNGMPMILLDANENPYQSEINRYPDPMQLELKHQIAQWKSVKANQIYLSNGSDEFISNVILACCEPAKDQIMILPPTFGMYKVSAQIHGIGVQEVPLTDSFQPDAARVLQAADQTTKVIFIPTPNNPTSNSFNLDSLVQIIKGFPGLVVVDEAYTEFSSNPSLISELDKYPNLMICQTFSKAQGMAGARLGMAFGHEKLIALFNRIKAPYNINSMTANAALKRVKEQNLVTEQVQLLLAERKRLEEALTTVPFVKKCYPSDANFLFIRVDDSNLRYQQLLEKGIVVRNPSSNYNCENTLRITVGLPSENKSLIEALRSLI